MKFEIAAALAATLFAPGAPVEIFESEYPLRIRAFELICDSAGAGRYRGGVGYAREFEVLEDAVLTVRSSPNHKFTAQGFAGGGAPAAPRVILNPYRADRSELGPLETRALRAGDIIRFERGGGAGYGDPRARDPEAIRADIRNGYVSARAAKKFTALPRIRKPNYREVEKGRNIDGSLDPDLRLPRSSRPTAWLD
jgi:N-methylhydantoinase B